MAAKKVEFWKILLRQIDEIRIKMQDCL